MEQFWQVINLDKRETFGDWGTLTHCLFHGSPKSLIACLAVRPPRSAPTLNGSMTGQSSQWSGDRILCISDACIDYPADVLTTEEIAEIDASGESLFSFAKNRYAKVQSAQTHYPFRGKWILRNLSKRLFVRFEALSVDPVEETIDRGMMPQWPGLGEALLSQVLWSSDARHGLAHDGDITRGAWAGDRFDIIPLEHVELKEGEEAWKDVSKEVKDELFAIWESFEV